MSANKNISIEKEKEGQAKSPENTEIKNSLKKNHNLN
jgi:hypothetical protein